ncbi:phage tail protein [Pectobacterium carotovorum]|uniref:Phage tail fibre protein N-terminal domain-containing protein n=1 Tax=Pectobacterium carotovorum subsp. carotovorum TaxID=555 RepID=A0AAI9L2G6_PECCC|nr:phage tail protein [Pectobacterium carotovorum]GKX48553.1 hypothetical protein SOASR016_33050 [Pectobacterium carotovorum subsp. carotovorum]GLV70996.1 hypothetical protein Pcaca03_34400 [Pectobacterium carotovorum subsp. carotovorum]
MSATYFALLTNIGAAKLANATALGSRLNITQMAVGDGDGLLPTPNPAQTALINEKRRAAINVLSIDPKNPSQIIAEQVIPENEGGWWVREVGLFDDDGNLIAVANCPETYKPLLQQGSGRVQTVRMILIVSSTDAVTLKIDPAVVLATRSYVDTVLAEHEKNRKHPDGTLTARGFVQLSNATSSDSETLAATPKAVKAANDNANGRVPSVRRVNGKALSADITLGAGDVGAYTKLETDTAISVVTAAANNANTNANSRVPSDRRVNGKALSADITLNAADVGAYTTSETDTRVAAAANAAANANTNASGRVPSDRKVNGKALTANITLGAGDVGALAKDQNGADIPNKVMFAKNASVPLLGSGWVNFGNSTGAWTTPQFIDFLNDMGAFEHGYFVCAGTWNYSTNKKIIDTGCGHVELAGAVVEVFASRFNLRTVRVTTMSSSSDPDAIQGQFVYVESETTGSGEWRREFNTKNLTPADIGALTTEGTAAAAAKLSIARTINSVAFDGTANISLTPANIGALPAEETAVAASKLATPRKINGVAFDGSSDIDIGSRVWISSEYTPATSTPIVVSHGLSGINPLHCRCDVLVKCITAEGGYQAGDFAINPMTLFMQNDIAHPYCLQPALNASTVQLNIMHHLSASFKTSTIGNQYLNMANWRCVIRIFY